MHDLTVNEPPFVVRVELAAGGAQDELVLGIDPKGSKAAYPFAERGVLRTVYITADGKWRRTWRWPNDSGVQLAPDSPVLGLWCAHVLLHGKVPETTSG